jgi:hypothetical protein
MSRAKSRLDFARSCAYHVHPVAGKQNLNVDHHAQNGGKDGFTMNAQDTMGIPVIDPNVQYVGVSKLRTLNADKLGSLDKTLVIQDDDKPLAVVLSYRQFLAMQKERGRILATLETIFTDEDRTSLVTALLAARKGNTKSDSEVRGNKKKGGKRSEQD